MPDQTELPWMEAWRLGEKHARVLAESQRVARLVGHDEIAETFGLSPGHISNTLYERDGKHLRVSILLYLLSRDPTMGLAEAVADAARCVVQRRRELTPQERLERLESALAELGPEIRDLVKRKAGL